MTGLYPIIRRVRRPLLVVASQRPPAPVVREDAPIVENADAVPVEVVRQPATSESVVAETRKERHGRKANPAAQT